jgi:hypothetical protein
MNINGQRNLRKRVRVVGPIYSTSNKILDSSNPLILSSTRFLISLLHVIPPMLFGRIDMSIIKNSIEDLLEVLY